MNEMSAITIPTKVHDAFSGSKWDDAMTEDRRALQNNQTLELVPLPKGKKLVGCVWVLTIKHKATGTMDKYRTKLVARGFTQTYGIDYQETFAHVAKINTIRVLLSVVVNLEWPLQRYDVKKNFLYGDLCEEVYMSMPWVQCFW